MITPLGTRVLLKRLEKSSMWGSLHLPDSAQSESRQAEVIALGVGKDKDGKDASFTVKVGDVVLVPPQGAVEVTVDAEKHLVIEESAILAIVAP